MPRKKKVSLKDIANKVGVSTALVSYVLNGKEKETRVGSEIAARIKKIAAELQYKPNHVAKSLRSGKTHTLGLIIADIANPFFANIAREVENEAKKSGYTVFIGSSDENHEKFKDLIAVFLSRQVDGLILVVTEHSFPSIQLLLKKQTPFVLLDRYFPNLKTDFVSIDSFKASYTAATHLLHNGYHNLGYIGYQSHLHHVAERKRGVLSAMKEARIKPRKHWINEVSFDKVEEGIKGRIDLMLHTPDPVDAIIFGTYRLAINGLKHINDLGIKVPDHLAIVSYGQSESFELFKCPISYLEQPLAELGKKAVELLFSKINNPGHQTQQIHMDATLNQRASSQPRINAINHKLS